MRMNPDDWNYAANESLQRRLIPDHRTEVNSRGVNSVTSDEWQTFCRHARHTVDEAQSLMGGNVAREQLCVSSHDFYINDAEADDPDGESLEVDEEDPELRRKRKQLQEIEEQIMFKRASIALKTVEPLLKKTTSPDIDSYSESATRNVASLKDRVNLILQQHRPSRFLSTVRSPKERMNSSSLIKNGPPQDDHPLKLRVKALMKQRISDSFYLPAREEAPDCTPSPLCRSNSSPGNEDVVHKGFQRFLSILNEGVDMDFLSRIVNDDSPDLPLGEELLNVQVPAVESMSDTTFDRERQQSDHEASLPDCNRANSEGECDKPTEERSLGERLSMPANEDEARSPSKSPAAVKTKEEEEEKPEVDEQRAQLQNILQSLGLSLEVDEMSKLADRTRERLYGKKHEGKGPEQEIRQRGPQRHYSKSSSSSSSSRSNSRSNSRPSPSRRRRSHGRESRQRSECGRRSGDRKGEELACHGGLEDSKEEQSYGYHDEKNTKEMFSYQQNHMYSQPAALSAFPQNDFYQSSQYTAYHSDSYDTASNSYWTSAQVAPPPFFYTSGSPHPQNAYQLSPSSEVPPVLCDPYRRMSLKNNRFRNPDPSGREGQTGSFSVNRCLQVLSTDKPPSCLQKTPPKPPPTPPPQKKKKKKKKKKNKKNVQTEAHLEYIRAQRESATFWQKQNNKNKQRPNKQGPRSLNTNLFMNPDLSGSEGQTGFFSRQPCLQTVSIKSRLQQPPKGPKNKMNMKTKVHSQMVHVLNAKQRRQELRQLAEEPAQVNTPQPVEHNPEAEQSGKQQAPTEQSGKQQAPTEQSGKQQAPTEQSGKQQAPTEESGEQRAPTEEEIKANLRIKLKAFNLKMKQKAPEPGYALTSPTGEICGSS
ncbi:serine/arginine repetitive matrix protein 1-like [Pungitius pungitius]|uniref:serine/arginine repetitive matrix protein 1-like n=1 Tax=Pungitius pungitius TaxID=134920 RepID=UPI002E1015C5